MFSGSSLGTGTGRVLGKYTGVINAKDYHVLVEDVAEGKASRQATETLVIMCCTST